MRRSFIYSLAGYRVRDGSDESLAGGHAVAGIGYVSGVRCMLSASNGAIKGGAYAFGYAQEPASPADRAAAEKLPLVSLVDPAARIFCIAELFIDGPAHVREPGATVVPRRSTVDRRPRFRRRGGAYVPGLSDHVVMVRKQAKVFLAGPPLLSRYR